VPFRPHKSLRMLVYDPFIPDKVRVGPLIRFTLVDACFCRS